jgi:hypothetical protein
MNTLKDPVSERFDGAGACSTLEALAVDDRRTALVVLLL